MSRARLADRARLAHRAPAVPASGAHESGNGDGNGAVANGNGAVANGNGAVANGNGGYASDPAPIANGGLRYAEARILAPGIVPSPASAKPAGPRPIVKGKFLAVGGEKLYLRGVTYGTFGADP